MKIKYSVTLLTLMTISISWVILSCIPLYTEKEVTASDMKHPNVVYDIGCVECHTQETPEIVQQWASSGHGRMNFGCYICHGDGETEFSVKPASDKCISCHSSSMDHLEDVGDESCFSCHNGHTLQAE